MNFKASGALIMLMASAALAAEAPDKARSTPRVTPLTVGNLTLQQGKPAIIVSLTGASEEDMLRQASEAAQRDSVQMAELRADKLAFVTDAERVARLGHAVRTRLQGKPLLLTFRSKAEGGDKTLDAHTYSSLYRQWLDAGFADLIDIEMQAGEAVVRPLIACAHQRNTRVILSYHDFATTPSLADILSRLQQQDAQGADILKIALMPHSPADVTRLLDASWQMRQQTDKPMLIMAMGDTGKITRMSGELFGSNLTFASLGEASAPGQIASDELAQFLEALRQ